MANRIVIVGGGFAGLNAAKGLGGRRDVDVLLIDRRNHHLFQPLLYQVAMAGLSPAEIAAPIRGLLSGYGNIRVLLGEVGKVEIGSQLVRADCGTFSYDYLVMACGASHTYFGHQDWEEHAPGLKSLEEATEIRRRVLWAFEKAEGEASAEKREALTTFVVVGAGPTGVELAGALGEMRRFTLAKDFRNVDPLQARVILIEAGPRILPSFDEKLSARASRDLERLGVQVRTDSLVTRVASDRIELGQERLPASTVLWAAGVRGPAVSRSLGVELDSQGRVPVRADLSLEGHPEVFVLGDQAHCPDESGRPLPGVATVALQQGLYVASLIRREISGRERRPFRYWDKGQMATIGRKRAIVQSGRLMFGGYLAWLAWLLVHIYYLSGFQNRLIVMFRWAWAYLTFRRGARLITNADWREPRDTDTTQKEP